MTTHAYHRTKRQRIGNTITALLAFVLVVTACAPAPIPCLPEPTEDTSPPSALMLISYKVDGNTKTRTISEWDQEDTVFVDKLSDITVIYTGSDGEGMRKVQPKVTVIWVTGGTNQTESWQIQAKVASCPQAKVQDRIVFEQVGPGEAIKTLVTTTNWLGLTASTSRITITARS